MTGGFFVVLPPYHFRQRVNHRVLRTTDLTDKLFDKASFAMSTQKANPLTSDEAKGDG